MITPDLTAYHEGAKPIVARFDDQLCTLLPKVFSTGSVGWYANAKVSILVGEKYYPCQVSLTLTVIGSKNSHGQEGTPEAKEEPEPILLGPTYPYNRSEPEGAILGQQEPSGDLGQSANGEQKPRKAARGKKATPKHS